MSLDDTAAPDTAAAASDRLRHDLISPLTAISGRSQLLARMIQRSSSLTDAERDTLLAGLSTIGAAVHTLVTQIDAYSREDTEGGLRPALIAAPAPADPAP